jgi:hypothetical protein
MKLKYVGEGLKGLGMRFVKGGVYEFNGDIAHDLLKRGGFEIVKSHEPKNFAHEGSVFVEKGVKNIKKEGK